MKSTVSDLKMKSTKTAGILLAHLIVKINLLSTSSKFLRCVSFASFDVMMLAVDLFKSSQNSKQINFTRVNQTTITQISDTFIYFLTIFLNILVTPLSRSINMIVFFKLPVEFYFQLILN